MPRGKKRAEPDEPETDLRRSTAPSARPSAMARRAPVPDHPGAAHRPVMAEDGRVVRPQRHRAVAGDEPEVAATSEPMGKKLCRLCRSRMSSPDGGSGALSAGKCRRGPRSSSRRRGREYARDCRSGRCEAMKSVAWYDRGWYGLARTQRCRSTGEARGGPDDPSAFAISRAYPRKASANPTTAAINRRKRHAGPPGKLLDCDNYHEGGGSRVALGRSPLGEEAAEPLLPGGRWWQSSRSTRSLPRAYGRSTTHALYGRRVYTGAAGGGARRSPRSRLQLAVGDVAVVDGERR